MSENTIDNGNKKKPLISPETKQAVKEKSKKVLSNKKVQKGLIIGAGILVAGYGTKKLIDYLQKNSSEKNYDDESVQQAMLFRSAMNPSGISWMRSFDGTADDSFWNVAESVTDFDKVKKQYRKLYKSSLLSDIQSEISATEYKRFLYLVSGSATEEGTDTSKYILVKRKAKIYESIFWFPLGSLKEIPANSYLELPTDLKTTSLFTLTDGNVTFIHSEQYNASKTVKKSLWINMADVILATKTQIKEKYASIAQNKVVFSDDEFE